MDPLGTRDDDAWADDAARRSESGRVVDPWGAVDIDADGVGLSWRNDGGAGNTRRETCGMLR